MSEQLNSILKRIDSRHLSKLWGFYRDYFSDDTSCLQFFYNALKEEPENKAGMDHLSDADKGIYTAENGDTIFDSVFIPRRMLNTVERLVMAARDMEQIRQGKDVFKIVFLVTCVESLQNLIGYDDSKLGQLFDFFENYTSDTDKEYIASHFILDDQEVFSGYDGFKAFVGAINEYRNCAAHEGDYWNYCFNNNDDEYPLLVILKIDLAKFSRKNKMEHCFQTTISYKKFEEIFIRTCIRFVQTYISREHN